MSNVMIDSSYMTGIANAIRTKSGTQDTYLPSEMPSAITNIPTGTVVPNFPTNNNTNNIWVAIGSSNTTVKAIVRTSGDSINWGDGTTNTSTTHTYTNTGMYCIQAVSLLSVNKGMINAEYNRDFNNSFRFYQNRTLTNLKISTTNFTSMSNVAFCSGCSSLTSVELPNTITSFPDAAFENCILLPTIDLSNIASIGSYAFENCTALTTVNLSNTITSIPSYCFKNCDSLMNITIPASVTSLKNGAFSSGMSINNRIYHFLGTTPPTIDPSAYGGTFYMNVNPIFYVPAESVEAYQTAFGATWGQYVQAEPSN